MEVVFFEVILSIFVYQVDYGSAKILAENRYENYACFGNGIENFMDANCSDSHVIAVDLLWAGAKTEVLDCVLPSLINRSNRTDCCIPDRSTDCLQPYRGVYSEPTRARYYERCSGMQECDSLQVAQMETTCNSTIYERYTHYMTIQYYCIPKSKITAETNISLTTNLSPTYDSIQYIWNSEYPNPVSADFEHYSCSVQTSDQRSNAIVQVVALDIRFEGNNGTCNFTMRISNGRTEKVITCYDNVPKEIEDIYNTTLTDYLCIEINKTGGAADSGHFWFGIKGSGLIIDCPSIIPIDRCTVEKDPDATTVTPTITPTETTTIHVPVGTPSVAASQSEDDTGMIVGIVVGILALIAIILIIIIYRWWKKKKESENKLTDQNGLDAPETESAYPEPFVFPEVLGKNQQLPPMVPPSQTKAMFTYERSPSELEREPTFLGSQKVITITEINKKPSFLGFSEGPEIDNNEPFLGKPTATVPPFAAPALAAIETTEKKEKRRKRKKEKRDTLVNGLNTIEPPSTVAKDFGESVDDSGVVEKKKKRKKKKHVSVDGENEGDIVEGENGEKKRKSRKHHKRRNEVAPEGQGPKDMVESGETQGNSTN